MELKSYAVSASQSVTTLPMTQPPQQFISKVKTCKTIIINFHEDSTGILEAPTDVKIEASVERVIVSWSPPFTLGGVPILHYSVYITSQGVSEQRNTTETHISLERPCASTTYQISAWNEVGEGNATRKGNTI